MSTAGADSRSFTRRLLGAIVALGVVGLAAAGPADAADRAEPMVVTNPTTGSGSGNEFVRPSFGLSAPCPEGSTTYYATLHGGERGATFPADGQLIKVPGSIGMSFAEPFTVAADYTFMETALDAGLARLAGRYTVQVTCQDSFSNVLRQFRTSVVFTSPSTWESGGNGADVPAATSTTTATIPLSGSSTEAGVGAPGESPSVTATDSDGIPLPGPPAVAPGGGITVRATGFAPGEKVVARIGSGRGGRVTSLADSDGVASYRVTIPDDGTHGSRQLTVTGRSGTARLDYEVAGSPAADIGAEDGLPWLGLLGGSIVVAAAAAAAAAVAVAPTIRRRAAKSRVGAP